MEDELAESNRKIEELARALQAEREKVAAAEASIHKDAEDVVPAGRDNRWTGRVVDARMFMRPEPVLTERASFQRLPSVVTWFTAANQLSLLGKAVGHGKRNRVGVGVGMLGQDVGAPTAGEAGHNDLGRMQIGVQEVRELREHESHVWCCALHPLVPLVATGSSDTTVRLWRLDGECLRVLRGHKEWVYSVAFDPMGDILCSAGFDGMLRLWNVSNGECLRIIRRSGISFHSVAFQPGTGAYIAAASSERVVRLYRVVDGEIARTLVGHTNAVTCVSFQPPDGKLLATASVDCTIRVWRAADGSCVRVMGERSKAKVWACAFDRSGLVLASGGSDNVVRVWRVADGTVLSVLSGHKGAVRSVAFHPHITGVLASGEGNLTWGSDNSVRLWFVGNDASSLLKTASSSSLDMIPATCKAIVLGHSKMVTCVAFPPDGSILVTTSRDSCVRLWGVSVGDRNNHIDTRLHPAAALTTAVPSSQGMTNGNQSFMSQQEAQIAAQMSGGNWGGVGNSNYLVDMTDIGASDVPNQLTDDVHSGAADIDGPHASLHPSQGESSTTVGLPATPQWVKRMAGSKGAAASDELRSQMEALTSKIKVVTTKTVGGDPERMAAAYIKKISNLWRGSLISEDEIQKIRRERESRRTDEERAQDLYWSMYHDRLAHTAATAFSEVSEEVKEANGGKIESWDRERRGKARAEPVSAVDIQKELDGISAALAIPEDHQAEGTVIEGGVVADEGEEGGGEEGYEGGVEKSEALKELEALVKEQKQSRRAFNERLLAEQESLAALTQRASEQQSSSATPIDAEELKKLIKAATLSGYRLAELKREREEKAREDKLGQLHTQRAKFEGYVTEQRQLLKEQTEKVNDLLEHMKQRAVWDAEASAQMHEHINDKHINEASRMPMDAHSASGGAGPFYRRPLPAEYTPLASAAGRSLLRSSGERSEEMVFGLMQTITDPFAGGPGREPDNDDPLGFYGALVAMAAALNALDVDGDRLWQGPWRWQSAHWLHMALPQGTPVPDTAVELAALAATSGAHVQGWEPKDASLDMLRDLFHLLLGPPQSEVRE